MRKLSLAALLCCTLWWIHGALAGTPAELLVEKAIRAAGGADKLKKHQAQTWNEKGTYYGMGEGLPYTSKLAAQLPDQFRMSVFGGSTELFTIVLNKDKGWIKDTEGKVREMTREELKHQQDDAKIGLIVSLLPLKDKAFKLKAIPGVDVDKMPTSGLSVTRDGYPDVKLYFDKKSNLLVKSEYEGFSSEQKKKVQVEILYQKYKLVDGAQVPTQIVLKHDGKLFVEADIIDLKAEGTLEAKVFDMPK